VGAVLLNCDCHEFDYIVAVVMGVAGLSYTEAIDVMDTVNFGRLDWAWFDGGCWLILSSTCYAQEGNAGEIRTRTSHGRDTFVHLRDRCG
jgi:hypothetical protein